MKDQRVLYSIRDNDECYTPAYAVVPILKYLSPDLIVWCPFDKEDSQFVKLIGMQNEVIHSHISDGKDFFEYEPERWDVIVSNPPFRKKRQIFERAMGFQRPFALLMTLTWLNDSAPKQLFRDRDLQLLMFDKRIQFTSPNIKNRKKITFSTGYYCCEMLPKQIIMEHLE